MFRYLTLATMLAAPVAAMAAMPMSGLDYVKKAGASDMFEITEAKLMASSTNPKIRDFAMMMMRDHTKSTDMVKAAAHAAGETPAAPMMDPMQQQMVAKLRAASGPARDMLYVTQQKQAHQMALTLHRTYAADGTVAPLKATAAKIVPVVQGHITMLNAMHA